VVGKKSRFHCVEETTASSRPKYERSLGLPRCRILVEIQVFNSIPSCANSSSRIPAKACRTGIGDCDTCDAVHVLVLRDCM
jgi:hypothetical protein